jgi:hypothetical protein
VLPMNIILIYIRNHSMVFSHLFFHVNSGVVVVYYALMNDNFYDAIIY